MTLSGSLTVRRNSFRALRSGRRLASIVYLLIMAIALTLIAAFGMRMRDTASLGALPPTAVVFTGQFNRVTGALNLLSERKVAVIFISGVNAGAGIRPTTFADQFNLSDLLRQKLAAGDIILAPRANDTLENGCETAQWLAENPDINSVVLITSRFHMPRASFSLARATDNRILIQRQSVDDANATIGNLVAEFMKFTKTLIISFVPFSIWMGDRSGICQVR